MPFRATRLACCGLAFVLLAGSARAADDPKLFPAEVAIPNSRVIPFTSAIDKEPYTLQISIPLWPAPKSGYPVLYVLDGDLYFPEAAMASDALGDKGAVVVGIGHNVFNDRAVIAHYASRNPGYRRSLDGNAALSAFNNMRNRDFRWPAKPEHRAPAFIENIIGPETGDLDAFLQVIEKEIKPKVEALAPINRRNQALFGHSAGGLAVVRALFTEPTAFRTFIAASPALWYDGGAVLDGERQFDNDVTRGLASPHVLLTAGALEPHDMALPKEVIAGAPSAQRAAVLIYSNMRSAWPSKILGSRDLAVRLKALHGKPGYRVDYQVIADQDHQSSAFVAIIRAMPFAFVDK